MAGSWMYRTVPCPRGPVLYVINCRERYRGLGAGENGAKKAKKAKLPHCHTAKPAQGSTGRHTGTEFTTRSAGLKYCALDWQAGYMGQVCRDEPDGKQLPTGVGGDRPGVTASSPRREVSSLGACWRIEIQPRSVDSREGREVGTAGGSQYGG